MLEKVWHAATAYLKKWNFYDATNEDTLEETRNQIIASRVFLLLLAVSLIGLVEYTSLSEQVTTVQIDFPSRLTFEKLYSNYPDTLVCPCSQTLIEFQKFVNVTVSSHQICSSGFVSDEWISSIANAIPNAYFLLDIRRMISSELQLIASQCRSSQLAVADALQNLGSNQFFISTMLSSSSSSSQVNTIVQQVKNSLIAAKQQNRQLIQSLLQQNHIPSALGSNILYMNINATYQGYYMVEFLKDQTYPPSIGAINYATYELCSCVDSSNCTYPSGIYPDLAGVDSYRYKGSIIPFIPSSRQIAGLQVGCMPLDSVMESTLECFYDSDCLLTLFNTTSIEPLNSEMESIFTPTTDMGTLMNALFLERWSVEMHYHSFFEECQPMRCTYSYYAKGNLAFVTTTILSLIGGLSIAIKVLAPLIVYLYRTIEKKCQAKSSDVVSSTDETNRISIRTLFDRVRQWILNFNLFRHPYNDAHGRKNELWTTRIYILSMIVGFIVIIFYASAVEHSLTYNIESPSLSTYRKLITKYPSSTCECNRITCSYSVFLSFAPDFFQGCSSIFTTNAFLPRFDQSTTAFTLGTFDIRTAAPTYFALLSYFCSTARTTASQAMSNFLQGTYVSSYLTSEEEFRLRINASLTNFKLVTPTTFNHLLQLVRDTTQGNQLLAGSFSNAKLQYITSPTTGQKTMKMTSINPTTPSCSCGMSADLCSLSFNTYCADKQSDLSDTYTCQFWIPGLNISCYLIDGVLTSTLECLYDLACILPALSSINYDPDAYAALFGSYSVTLNRNTSSRFTVNATVLDISKELAIENWNEMISYENYYNSCDPLSCSYTTSEKFHIPTVIATTFGLIGGLSVILQFCLPLFVKVIRRSRRTQLINVESPENQSYGHRLLESLHRMNFFKTIETEQSEELCHDQRLATRLYIILWLISVIVLAIYTGLSRKTTIYLIDSPSMSTANQLQSMNLNEFACPCTKIPIPFETFTSLEYSLHQICSSDFVADEWLKALFSFGIEGSRTRAVFSSHFQLLQSFCRSSKQILTDSTASFYENQLISVKLLTQDQFHHQSETLINNFQQTIQSSFRQNLATVVDITLGNQLMSVYETNWYFRWDSDQLSPIYAQSQTYQSGDCSCGDSRSSLCADPLILNTNTSVPGMFIGCLPLTSLRLSSIQCLYDDICLDGVKKAFNLQSLAIRSLNAKEASRFLLNTTLDNIIDNLMIEQWTSHVNYTDYFNQCNPHQCRYLAIERNNALFMFTTLLGLYGGLTVSLKFVAPTLITIGRKIYNKCRSIREIAPKQTI